MNMIARKFGYSGSKWDCYFYVQAWSFINLGFHIDLFLPNIEIHIPFGFFRIGRKGLYHVHSGKAFYERA